MSCTSSADAIKQHECSNLQEKVVKLNTPAGKLVKSVAYECVDCSMMYVSQDKAEKLKQDGGADKKQPMLTDVRSLLNDPLLASDIHDIDWVASLPGASGNNSNNAKADTEFFSCKQCKKTMLFTSHATMMEHYKAIHNIDYVEDAPVKDFLPFDCKHCQKTFHSSSREDFEFHLLQCTNFSSDNSATHFECSLCGINFVRHHELVEHHRSQHMGEKIFKCEYCNAKFSWQENLERHSKIHEEETARDKIKKEGTRVMCKVCSNPFHSVVSLSSHMSLSHPNHPFTLDGSWGVEGSEVTKRPRVPPSSQPMLKLVDHPTESDPDLSDFVAELAASTKRAAAEQSDSEPAMKSIKTEKIITSEELNTNQVVIEVEEDLGVHKLVNAVAAQNDPHSLYCNSCDKTYQNPQEDTPGSMNLRCMHCGWTFKHAFQLEAHLDHLHPSHIRQSVCLICMEHLRNNTAMDKHYATAHPESRAFHCYQCDSRFNTKSCLRGHLLRHQQSVPSGGGGGNSVQGSEHVCPHCSMRYAHAHQLLTHVTKSHPTFAPRPPPSAASLLLSARSGPAPTSASTITSSTSIAAASGIPLAPGPSGLGNTQFICGFCSKKFAYEGSLKIHLKSHEAKIKAQVLATAQNKAQ